METFWNFVFVVSLLVLSAPQRCSGVDHGSLELQDVKLLSALQIVNDALKCTSENIKEGLRLHEKNNEALKDLQSLPEMVLMMKEQMHVQNENMDSMKKQLTDLHREGAVSQENAVLQNQLKNKEKMIDELSQEIARLKNQLENKDKIVKAVTEENKDVKEQLQNKDERVRHLEESVAECQQLVSNHTNTEELLNNKVQILEKRIMEHQEKEEQLEETMVQLNNTVAAQRNDTDCVREYVVRKYINTKDWESLRKALESVLDHSSEPCIQLQRVDYSIGHPLWHIGYYGSMQLASLLLDAGLPVNTVDARGNTILHGAVEGGHMLLAKLLLARGAGVHVRGLHDYTPLMYAAFGGHLEMVQHLVSAGADTTATDNDSHTALDIARRQNRHSVVQYLQQLPH